MVLNSYSKINLSLSVNSKQKNGLHNIQSYFCLISLKDKIKIKKIRGNKDKVVLKGTFAKLIKNKDNSIKSLLNILRKLNLISSYYSITVEKKIPVFAGLGGGTSNAATVMKHIIRDKLNRKSFSLIEKIIGTDLKLFFHKRGFIKSLGSIIDLKLKQKFFFVLVQPPIKCSTREIYSKIKKYSKKTSFLKRKMSKSNYFLNLLSKSKNDLQSVVEKKYPKIKSILDNIHLQKGCSFSRITGSGSVCYGLFVDEKLAKKAYKKLKHKYPKFWISFAKTV